ncbi:polysaccharide deacetylase family protein [Advenella mimigardefordensis]|uniref:Putative bifunctional xylanase/deacetylase n=1 Tax=Advenella mimigardefordensis (strain DSM 17166 / LMG 22922 / DPN7) TaxID=1247726 RepID=W0PAF4_ADVMD|nr:polysaccharide deacetylase family protein [Advenella mimigardefordensis]AHG62400.1 putative bifunctional xylanase/deacetylase [Advenella mimigardefordensis DPN7]
MILWFRRHTLAAHLLVIALVVLLYLRWPAVAILVIVLYVAVLGIASMNMATNLFVDTLRHVHPGSGTEGEPGGQIALSFDDSPTEGTAQVLAILKAHNVKATFFIVGAHAAARPALLQQIVREGHAIGNHSYSHAHTLPFNRPATILSDLQQCSQTITAIAGVTPRMYRPPFGVVNPAIGQAVRASQLPCVGWSLRSFDTASSHPQRLLARITSRLTPGAIVLLHDYPAVTPQILPELLQEIKRRNFTCVLLSPETLRP